MNLPIWAIYQLPYPPTLASFEGETSYPIPNGNSFAYSWAIAHFSENIQFWRANFYHIPLIHNKLNPKIGIRICFHLEKTLENTTFLYPNVKILLNIFSAHLISLTSIKKENRKFNLCWISGSPIRLTKNINAKFYKQVHEAGPHHSRTNSPLLSTLHHSNEFHQWSA